VPACRPPTWRRLWRPQSGGAIIEHLGDHFKSDDAGAVVVLEVMEVCVPLEVVLGETILNLLEDDFVLGSMAPKLRCRKM
jgi:hypothetical protein